MHRCFAATRKGEAEEDFGREGSCDGCNAIARVTRTRLRAAARDALPGMVEINRVCFPGVREPDALLFAS